MPGKVPVYKARVKRDADGAVNAPYKKKAEPAGAAKGTRRQLLTQTGPAKKGGRTNPLDQDVPRARRAAVRDTAAARLKDPKEQTEKKKPAAKAGAKTGAQAGKASAAKPGAKTWKPTAAKTGAQAGKASAAAASGGRGKAAQAAKPAARKPAAGASQGKILPAGGGQKRPAKKAAPARRPARGGRDDKKEKAKFRDRKLAVSRAPGFMVTVIALLTAALEAMGLLLAAVCEPGAVDMQAMTLLCAIVPMGLLTTLALPRWLPVDSLIMALTNFLCGLSVVILYTVSPSRGIRQAQFYAIGLVMMIVMAAVVSRKKKWGGLTLLSILLGVCALILPLVFGQWQGGAKNWVSVPVLGSFQPSEFVKLSLVLTLAYYFCSHRTVMQMMPAILFAGGCLVLLMLQRDLGTALIYYLTTLVLFYVACGNVPMTILGLGGGAGAAVLGYRMFAHVKVRVAMWRNPWSDPLDKGYQIIQALLAIGSGGMFGVGLGQGTPEKIPAYYNDFIFAVICEQMGLVFGLLVLGVYVLLIMRGVTVISHTRRSFDMLLGCGVLAMLAIQTFMIVAGVIKMIPLTGVTMPFLSYGGSSLLSCLSMIGILHGVSARSQEDMEEDIMGAA